MNDSPLPGSFRATIILVSIMILLSSVFFFPPFGEGDLFTEEKGVVFSVKQIPHRQMTVTFPGKMTFKITFFHYGLSPCVYVAGTTFINIVPGRNGVKEPSVSFFSGLRC